MYTWEYKLALFNLNSTTYILYLVKYEFTTSAPLLIANSTFSDPFNPLP